MQVESIEIPLISSSFTYAPKVDSSFILEISPTRATEELIRILQPVIKFAKLILQEKKPISYRADKNHSNNNCNLMASIVDINLSTTVGTVPSTSSYLSSTPPVSGNNYASSLPESNRKRQKLSSNQGESNSHDGNTSIDTNVDSNNVSVSDNKPEEYNDVDGIERTLKVDILEKKTSPENERYVAPEQALVTSVELVVPAPPPPARELELEPKSNAGGLYNRSNSSSCDSTRLLLLPNDKIDGCVNDSSSSLNIRIPTKIALTTTATATTGDILLSDRRTSLWTPHQDQSEHTSDDTNKPDLVNHVSPELPYQQHHRHSELLLQIEKENTESETFPVPLQQHLQHNTPTQELQYGRPADANSIIDGQLRNNFYAQMLQQQHIDQQNHQQQMHEHSPRHQQQHSTIYTNYNAPLFQNAPLFGTPQSEHHLRQQQQNPMECHGLLDQSTSLSHQQHQHQQHIPQHHHQQLQHPNQQQQQLQQQLQQQHHQQQLQQQHHHQQQQNQQPNQQPNQQQQQQHQHQQQQQQQQQHLHQLQQQNQLQQPHQQQHQIQQHQRQQEQLQEQHQQRQLHETYHDLIMEDFHEEPSSAYKLTLSPNNVKPENQDDGYETSAGDVLTPNSHSSSTNSVTPQHQMQQHPSIGIMSHIPNQKKTDEQLLLLSKNPINNEPGAASSTSTALAHSQLDLSMSTVSSSRCQNSNPTAVVDPFSFMGEEMRSMLSSPAAHHRHMESITLGAPTSYATQSESGPLPVASGDDIFQHPPHHGKNNLENSKPTPKKRGRKKKMVTTTECTNEASMTAPITNQDTSSSISAVCEDSSGDLLHALKPKERKKHDRFNGMSEDEVIKRTIPDHLCDNLDIVIVGINPGLFAAYKGHHYAGPGNHFWKCLYLAGLTQEQMSADEDHQLLKHGIGFTNMVARATKGSADLTRKEIKEGSRILLEKLQRFRPKIAVFNGKLIFEVFSGKKEFHFGRQPDRVDGTDTYIWVMPSSSARCAQLPRAADKVPFYAALKKFRDFLRGLIPQIDESECVFTDQRIRQCSEQQQQQNLDNKGNQSSQSHQPLSFIDNCGSSSSIAGDCGGNPDGQDNITSNKLMTSHMISNVPSSDNNNPYTNDTADSPMRNPSDSTSYLTVFGHQSIPQQPLEKKKRGRPKKIKGQQDLIMDHRAQQYNHHHHHDFNNILNLSVVETPKKKRGRPKKVKPTANLDNLLVNKQLPNPSNSLPAVVHPLEQHTTTTTDASPPQTNNHQQLPPSLYNTPPPSHILYTASASPMASPAAGMNCNYTQVHNQGTLTAIAVQEASPNDHLSLPKHGSSLDQQPHLGETPPPSSPNMCGAIDFEQPENQPESKVRSTQNKATDLAQQVVEKEKYSNSPSHDAEPVQVPAHPNEHHYHQHWLSSPHHPNSLESPQSKQLPPPPIHHYHHQEQAEQWQRGYEEQSRHPNPYLLIPSAHQNHQHLSPRNANQSLGNFGSDVARKSLCGLESLVDQIPAIREHDESMSATAQAAAAAVESRLLGLQQQQHQQHQNTQKQRCNQDQEPSGTSDNNNVINNNNFSVSSLVAAKTDNENIYLNNSGEHRGNVGESLANNNTNIEYYHHQHHVVPPHLIGGTTINSSEPNLQHPHSHPLPTHSHPHSSPHTHSSPHSHPSPHPHPSPHSHPMYMELTNHLSHIPALNVNSAVYSSTTYGSHLQHGTGSGSGPGSGSGEYTTGPSHNGHFSPVQVQSSPVSASTTPTLHVPSPNYPFHHHPYGGHAAAQASYPSYVHPSHHGHHHPPPPHHHHLSVFDHLKPSDIGGYGGF